ncbi:kinase-like domain-containing protein, partial [Dichotomocladium elegans]
TGVFSTVEKSYQDGRVVAIKSYKKQHGKLVMDHYKRELWALQSLDIESEQEAIQNHVIYLLGTQSTPSAQILTFPFYQHTLMDFVNQSVPQLAYEAVYQVALGLSFLHEREIVHCDLSPSNILVDASKRYMTIADFGCAHRVNERNGEVDQEEIGTRYYKAPEHLFGHQVYTPATDIWALGTIFCHLLGGHPLFSGESDIELIGQIVRVLGHPSRKVLDEVSHYPDTNKLVFFGASPQSDNEAGD